MESKETVKIIAEALLEKKAHDLKVIDISNITTLGDYFVICDGSNPNQLDAMCDEVEERLHKAGVPIKHREGHANTGWILLDYYAIIVHVFSEEARAFYGLENIWRDGTFVDPEKL